MPTRDLFLAAAGALLLAGAAASQQPAKPADAKPTPAQPAKPAADSLEALMADALKHNPNIQEATASVRAAEAKLNKVKNEVMVEIASIHKILTCARVVLQKVEESHRRRQALGNQFSPVELQQSEIEVARARATVAGVEADLMKLVGRVPGKPEQPAATTSPNVNWPAYAIDPSGQWLVTGTPLRATYNPYVNQQFLYSGDMLNATRLWELSGAYVVPNQPAQPASAAAASVADKLRQALQKPLKADFKDARAEKVLAHLVSQGLQGVAVRNMAPKLFEAATIDQLGGELPLAAWLQALQDSVPEVRFVVRDYGLLITTADRVPPDGIPLGQFLQRAKAPDPKPTEAKKEEKKN